MSELGLHAQGQWMPTGTLRSQMRNTSKNAIFGKYVRRHLVSVEHRSFGLVHGKGVFYKCETSLGCKLQYKHLCSQRKKRSELLPTLPNTPERRAQSSERALPECLGRWRCRRRVGDSPLYCFPTPPPFRLSFHPRCTGVWGVCD